MAYTSIWAVKGWLGKLVIYVENPEKTENPTYYESEGMTGTEIQGLSDVIEYAAQESKTSTPLHHYVSGVNCRPTTARDVMLATKRKFGKENGIVAYHGIQSFSPGETTPEIAHEVGVKLAERLWGDRYEVLVTTHLDRESLHNHLVVNTVSFVDGIRYHRTNDDYRAMQTVSDSLCLEYGLSVIDAPERGRSKHYAEWEAERRGQPTYRSMVRADVDAAIAESISEGQLWENLRRRGYAIKFGQDITIKPEGKSRGLKLERNFGEDYSLERLRARVLENTYPQRTILPITKPPRQIRTTGTIAHRRKCTGLRVLYFSYLYKMGVLPRQRERKPNFKRVYFLYREDIRFVQRISTGAQLLARHKIDTLDELVAHKEALRQKIAEAKNPEERKEIRREVQLCTDIETRSISMQEKIRTEQKSREKEGHTHDKRRGRSRTTDTSIPKRRGSRA